MSAVSMDNKIVICLLALIVVLGCLFGNSTHAVVEGHASMQQAREPTLFLYPEGLGWDIPEVKAQGPTLGLDTNVLASNFKELAVVANASYKEGQEPLLKALNDQWNPSNVSLTGLGLGTPKKWIAFYLSKACFDPPGDSSSTKPTAYQQGLQAIQTMFGGKMEKVTASYGPYKTYTLTGPFQNSHGIDGIVFDNEGVQEIHEVVKIFEAIKGDTGIQIGWTLAPGSAKNCGPKDLNKCYPPWTSTDKIGVCSTGGSPNPTLQTDLWGINTIPWDVCLAQVYTEGISEAPRTGFPFPVYQQGTTGNGCAQATSDFWERVNYAFGCQNNTCAGLAPGGKVPNPHPPPSALWAPCEGLEKRGVPMVCGAGNCQEPDQNGACLDERMSGKAISALIKSRPSINPFTDFAIWYGSGHQKFCKVSCSDFAPGPSPTPPSPPKPAPTDCSVTSGRPKGCPCNHSWDCASNYCTGIPKSFCGSPPS